LLIRGAGVFTIKFRNAPLHHIGCNRFTMHDAKPGFLDRAHDIPAIRRAKLRFLRFFRKRLSVKAGPGCGGVADRPTLFGCIADGGNAGPVLLPNRQGFFFPRLRIYVNDFSGASGPEPTCGKLVARRSSGRPRTAENLDSFTPQYGISFGRLKLE
jgi:hypothetical protein